MDQVISPVILYVACGLGALGVMLAMPQRRRGVAAVGGLLAAVAGGGVLLGLLLRAVPAGQVPNVHFYIFSLLALASGLRMITHPRPVYAALYFILTIIASSGLYLILSAEFMAFALIIIYAGAILITYLFVIMLATQAPSEDEEDRLSEYDAVAKDPVAASIIGFSLLAVLTTMLFSGSAGLTPAGGRELPGDTIAAFPVKLDRELLPALRDAGLVDAVEQLVVDADGRVLLDLEARKIGVRGPAGDEGTVPEPVRFVEVPETLWPASLRGTNVEGLGLNLLGKHPMTIEIAGVILLMAMLGATVLARKQVDIEEELKRRMARRLALGEAAP